MAASHSLELSSAFGNDIKDRMDLIQKTETLFICFSPRRPALPSYLSEI